ncbi:cytochrome P450 4F6-like [Mizuhopecten yessoensis]|uniref:Cytochrome P450 4F6 n=1 Tax=Mizuhopecten yessoensis TaxID=6573 RepID=A0A210PUD0_MIZYE|nr:cytochrome P450 4F6-like [Mizuhopecten yessoensis]XP_021375103.1 cytochrome P450 4F6-like [Mizuhopecten yessoensis]OWF40062.1 Cytochrome P450 4F6 [Mizuhopecten yessoensis]
MADLIEIVVALVTGYVLWTVVTTLWRYNALCRKVKNFSQIGPAHWFWGHMKLDVMSDLRSVLSLPDEELYKMSHNTKWAIVWMSFIPLIQANHPDSAKAVLKLSDPKPRGRGQVYSIFNEFLGDGLVTSNGKKWERNRKLLTPAFHFDVLRPYVKIYNEAADIVLEKFARQMKETPKSTDISDVLDLATLDVILRCSLSYEGNIQRQKNHPYAAATHRIGVLIMKRMTYPWQFISWTLYMMSADGKEYKKHMDYIHGFADDLIAKRKKALAENPSLLEGKHRLDFLDILMTAKDDSGAGLTDKEIRDEVDTFMFAGHDTTFAALRWALYNFGLHPEEQDKVYREVCDVTGDRTYILWEDLGKLHKLTLFMKESMRMFPPVLSTTRLLQKPLELDGVSFPAGTCLSVGMIGLHRHPDIYPDPKVFRPERFLPENSEDRDPYAFLPFSAGPRNCIGQNFSMNEQKVMLSRIIKRFKIVLDEDHDVIPVTELTLRPKNGIKIRFEER